MKHFKLRTDLKIEVGEKTLYRIEAKKDIKNFGVKAGNLGGYIENENNLFGNAWVCDNAMVYGEACVGGDALVCDNALVYGEARVYDKARVYGNAKVYNDAKVFGNARVCDNALVCGESCVYGEARVSGDALVCGKVRVCGDAEVFNDTIEKENDLINITSNVGSYNITITPKHIKIGCQHHSKTAWFNFTNKEIMKMDGEEAVIWWKKWKPILKQICDSFASNEEE